MSRLDQVLEFIQKTPRTPKQIASHLGITEQTANRYVRDLNKRSGVNIAKLVNDRTGNVRYTATGSSQVAVKRQKPTSAAKVSVIPNIPSSDFVHTVLDSPKTISELAKMFKVSKDEILTYSQTMDDVHLLTSMNKTVHVVIFSTGVASDKVEFKNSIFSRKGTSRIWNELTDKYIKRIKWEKITA